MANPLVCIFNPITTLIDQVQSESTFTGASAAGAPVVLNLNGQLDPSLLGEGTTATAGELLVAGALVNLYNNGGHLYMQNAYAAAVGTAPSGHAYPVPAVGFVFNNTSISNSSLVLFNGTFTYADPNSEFHVGDIGVVVYLSQVTPGGVTKTAPSGPGQISQSVGTVVGFTAPNFVLVSFAISTQPVSAPGGISTNIQFNNSGVFGGVPGTTADGTNGLVTIAPTGSGVGLTVTGDASTHDIQDWFVNGGGSPIVAIDTAGNLVLGAGVKDHTGSLGTSGQVLSTTGTQTVWVAQSGGGGGTPGGSPTQLQFNSAGTFAGAAHSSVSGTGAIVLGNATDGSPTSTTAFTVSASGGITISATDWYSSNEGTIVGQMLTSGRFICNGVDIISNVSIGAFPALNVVGGNAGSPDIADFLTAFPSTKVFWIDFTGNVHILEGLFDHTGSAGTSGQVLSSTGTQTTWVTPSSGSPGAPFTSIQFNNSGSFGGSANLEWNGTTVHVTGSTSTSGPDLMDLYTFGASGVNIGIAVQQISDSQGLQFVLTDSTGNNTTVSPSGIDILGAAPGVVSLQLGTSTFNNTSVSITGSTGRDILDLYTNTNPSRVAVGVDQYGEIQQGAGGFPVTIATSANPDPEFFSSQGQILNDVGAAASISAYGINSTYTYKGTAGSPSVATVFAMNITANTDPATTDSITALYGAAIFAYPQGSGGVSTLIGADIQAGQSTTGACTLIEPLQVRSAFAGQVAAVGSLNFIHVYGLGGTASNLTGAPPITGLAIDDLGSGAPVGSATYGINIAAQTQNGASNYGIYVAAGPSFLGDAVSITPTNTGVALSVTGDGFTNNILELHEVASGAVVTVDQYGDMTLAPSTTVSTGVPVLKVVGDPAATGPTPDDALVMGIQANSVFGGGYNSIQFTQTATGYVYMYTVNGATGNFSTYSGDGFGVTGSGSIFPQANTAVALTLQGDNFTSDILDVLVHNGGPAAMAVDTFGSVHITPPVGSGSTPALTITGDSSTDDILMLLSNTGLVDVAVFDAYGTLVMNPIAGSANAALTVTGDPVMGQDIASFNVFGVGAGVVIDAFGGTTLKPSAATALSILGDSGNDDLLDIYPYGPGPTHWLDVGFSVQGYGNLQIAPINTISSAQPALQVTGDGFPNNVAGFIVNGLTDASVTIDPYGNFITTGSASSIKTYTSAYTANSASHTINCNGTFTLSLAPYSFTLASVANSSGGVAIYTGTITGGASNAYLGATFTVAGFSSNNNGTFVCVASSGSTLTLKNGAATAQSAAATAAVTIVTGQELYIKNIGTGVITVSSSVNIDFSSSVSLSVQGQSVTVQWDGTQWWIY